MHKFKRWDWQRRFCPHFESARALRRVRVKLWLVLLAWILLAQTTGLAACLVVSGVEPAQVLISVHLEPETPFSLESIHSIDLAPVRETFVYRSGEGLLIIKVESPSAGVFEYYGLIPGGSGTAEIRRRLGDIRLLSHDYQNHRLTVGDKTFHFKGLVADGQPLLIGVRDDRWCEP
ncbi:MAG TPA: hypothetical protein VLK23_01840 [Thermodesulfobacteriota bacterium]|nr:hypothetical protein [Thermodesulfobacteriota bacterium]